MTVTREPAHEATGPVIGDELAHSAPVYWVPSPQSRAEGSVSEDVIARARRFNASTGAGSVQRTALLGLLLAELEHVPFEEVALLLNIKVKRLEKLMHGEEHVPKSVEHRWIALAEVVRHLHTVLRPEGTGKWLHTPIPALNDKTPFEEIKRGKIDRVLAVARSYRDPSFS